MASTRLETNFMRLLNRCEAMAADRNRNDWRLEKYVGALQEKLTDLRGAPCKPSQETLTEYTRKVELLKGLIEAEKLTSASDKAFAADQLPSSSLSGDGSHSKELLLQTKAKYHNQMRDELLGRIDDKPSENGVRQRNVPDSEDLDTVLAHHNQMQEKIAEEMSLLARNLKANVTAAGKIVQDDNKRLAESNKVADSNYAKLKVESERLEVHTKKSCNWTLWIMLSLVCFTFIWMVLFIRLFPKR
ncbi:vesicle transport protein USE1-like [Lineus longissimus]|uniref:vesicle transport protein USE1-like n=1 Tax=Lineus longissimus TaxID=88925 RepID=UPI00315CD6D2